MICLHFYSSPRFLADVMSDLFETWEYEISLGQKKKKQYTNNIH